MNNQTTRWACVYEQLVGTSTSVANTMREQTLRKGWPRSMYISGHHNVASRSNTTSFGNASLPPAVASSCLLMARCLCAAAYPAN